MCGRNYNENIVYCPSQKLEQTSRLNNWIYRMCKTQNMWWSVLSNHYKSRKILTSKAECYWPTSVWAALFQGLHASSCNDKNTIFQWNNRPCLPWSRAILCFQSDLVQEAFSGIEVHTILEPSNMEINFAVQILCISMLDLFSVQISMVKPFDLQKQPFLTPFENVFIYQMSQSFVLILQSGKTYSDSYSDHLFWFRASFCKPEQSFKPINCSQISTE